MMTPEQKAALRALAEKATPGPWVLCEHDEPCCEYSVVKVEEMAASKSVTTIAGEYGVIVKEDAAYIAAAHPQAVLALLDEVERLREAHDLIPEHEQTTRFVLRHTATRLEAAAAPKPPPTLAEAVRAYLDKPGFWRHVDELRSALARAEAGQ